MTNTATANSAIYDNRMPLLYGMVGFFKKQNEISITLNRLLPLENFYNDYVSHSNEYDTPLNLESYRMARKILASLDSDVPSPEILLENDGLVAFEWYKSRDRQISVSIYPDGSLGYAGIKGFTFFNKLQLQEKMPASLTGLIKEIMNVMTPSFRVN